MSDNIDCSLAETSLVGICKSIKTRIIEDEDQLDEIKKQIWIISGVGGGIALVLIIVLIVLAIQISMMRQKAVNFTTKANNQERDVEVATRNAQSENGEGVRFRQSSPHSYAQPQPPNKNITSEEELAQLGFSAYTGHPTNTRGMSTSPGMSGMNSAIVGVRVFPPNPQTGFRRNGAFNDGYM